MRLLIQHNFDLINKNNTNEIKMYINYNKYCYGNNKKKDNINRTTLV